jgi:hypothetical protein
MSQPLTLTLARKAPRTTQILGSLLVTLCWYCLSGAAARHASAGVIDLDADADRQNPLLRHRGRGAGSGLGLRGMLSLGTAFSSPWAAMRWGCT